MARIPRAIPGPTSQAYYQPAAPFIAPISGDLDFRLTQIADAINQKADRVAAPSFAWIRLQSPNGSTWAVSVADNGQLQTTQVLRE